MLSKEDWMEIKAQVEKGVYLKDIAEELGVHPKTVSRALQREGPPSGKRPGARMSKLDPFKPVIDELLREGVWNSTVILRELETRGYQACVVAALAGHTSGSMFRGPAKVPLLA